MATSNLRAHLALALVTSLLAGCFSYSPLEADVDARGLNLRARDALVASPAPERLRFAVVGDVQRGLDEAAEAVGALDRIEGLAFVVQVGDFTDLGLAWEYEEMIEVFEGLRVPWFVVIGNHDLLGNGGAIYDRAFGPRNLAFSWAGARFVLLDTNTVEYGNGAGVPDLAWLGDALSPELGAGRAVLFGHVWPWSEQFDPAAREPFRRLVAEDGVAVALYGHDHRHQSQEVHGVRHVTAEHVSSRTFLLVEEDEDGELEVRRVPF